MSDTANNSDAPETPPRGKAGRIFVTIVTLFFVGVAAAAMFLREHQLFLDFTEKNEWISKVIGNFHPLVLHLPIGIVSIVIMLEVMGWLSFGKWKPVTSFSLFAGVGSAALACVTGIMDWQMDSWSGDVWIQHMRLGVIFTAVLGLAFLAKIWGKNSNGRGIIYAILLFGSAGVMGFGAHLAGEEIHGPVFPKKDSDKEQITVVEKPVPERLAYEDVVVPILKRTCYDCHAEGESKKGGLLMDSFAGLLEGGDEAEALVPGDVKNSLMITRLHLPFEDEYHMPPNKRTKPGQQLQPAEKEILGWWVSALPKDSTELEDKTLAEYQAPAEIIAAIESLRTPEEIEAERLAKEKAEKEAKEAAERRREQLENSLASIKKDEAFKTSLNYVSKKSNDLEFSAVSMRKSFEDDQLAKLSPIADGLTNLNLGSTSVTEPVLSGLLPTMANLKKLNLSQTSVTDGIFGAIETLPNLKWLNLYGTQVTDQGIQNLAKLPNLEKVYLWNTKATPEGGEKLEKAHREAHFEKKKAQLSPEQQKEAEKHIKSLEVFFGAN